MNDIAEHTYDCVAFKIWCLLLNADIKIGQSLWSKAFSTSIYLLNWSPFSFLKYNYPLAIWLREYNFTNKSYTPDLNYLQTFNCYVYTKM